MFVSQVGISIKDPKTGKKTPTQQITPAPNSGKTVVKGAKLSKTPNGAEWTQPDLTIVEHEITAQVGQGQQVSVSTMGHGIEFASSPIAKNINFAPSDNMVFSADPDVVIENYISWGFDDYDGDPQNGWRIRIFPDFVVKSKDFDPNTNPHFVGEQVGNDTSNQVSISRADGFISGEKYWAFVQVAKTFQNQQWLGDWESEPFTVVIEQPQSPIMSVYTDNDNSLNRLVIQSTDNLFSDDNGEFTQGVGGWSVTNASVQGASVDTAGSTLDIAQTSIPLGKDLSSTTSISSITVGATGYVQSVGALSGTGVGTFKVSGANGKATAAPAFPTGNTPFWVQIDNEKILLSNNVDGTNTTADTFTISQRGYLGTTPAPHSLWSQVKYGLQNDIYAGSTGQLEWLDRTATTKTVTVSGRGSGTGSGGAGTVSAVGYHALLQTPAGQDNAAMNYIWMSNPGSLKVGDKGYVVQNSVVSGTVKENAVNTLVTIKSISYVGAKFGPTPIGKIVGTSSYGGVHGSSSAPVTSFVIELKSSKTLDNYIAKGNLYNTLNGGNNLLTQANGGIFPTIAAGTVLTIQGKKTDGTRQTVSFNVKLTQSVILTGPNAMNAIVHVTPMKSAGSFNLADGSGFVLPTGAELLWTPPDFTKSLAKLTISPALQSKVISGDYFSNTKSSTASSTLTTPTVASSSALTTSASSKTSSTAKGTSVQSTTKVEVVGYSTTNAVQDFVVGFNPVGQQPISFSSSDGTTNVYAIGNQTNVTSWTPGSAADSANLPLNAIQITRKDLASVSANQYANYIVDCLGVPLGATISSNTASSTLPNGTITFTVILNAGNVITPAWNNIDSSGNGVGKLYGGLHLSLVPPSSLIINAGSQEIPVIPFTPDVDYPLGHTTTSITYPPYFGGDYIYGSQTKSSHALVINTANSGNAEISIAYQGGKWFDATSTWNAQANAVPVNAGVTYGFAAWGTVIAGTASPQFNLAIDWYDQNGNYISSDNGSRSLSDPTKTNVIPSVIIGPGGGNNHWKPAAIVAKAPITTIATGANYFSVTTSGNLLQASGVEGSNQITLNSTAFTGITSGTLLQLDQYPISELVQVSNINGNTLTLVSNLLYDHNNAPLSTNSAYTLNSGISTSLSSGTEITMGSGVTVVTTADVKQGDTTIPVRVTFGSPTLSADTMTVGASYACPRILLNNVSATGSYGISNTMFKALTPELFDGYVPLSSTLPSLSAQVQKISGPSSDRAFVLPPSTPTEGAATIYLFDPTNDNGTYELHQGGGDPILDTVLSAPAQAGTTSLVLNSVEGLAPNTKLVLNVYNSLPSTTQTALDLRQAMFIGDTTSIQKTKAQQTAGVVLAQEKLLIADATETVLIDPSWDGSTNVVLQTPLRYNYSADTQVCAFTTSIMDSFAYSQSQGTPVAVFNWNMAGYTNTTDNTGQLSTTNRSYYYKVEKSEDFGVTWNPVWNGANLKPDSSGLATITDYDVIPNSTAFYRATAYSTYIDASNTNIVVNGVTSPPAQAPIVTNSSWWMSSTSNEALRFPVNIQNGIQETQKHPVGVFYPMGSSRPLTIAGVVQGRDATITIIWTDEDNWQNFIDMLNLGETLVLIDPVESERRYIFVSQDITATHQAASGKPYRSLSITYVEAAPPNFGYLYGHK